MSLVHVVSATRILCHALWWQLWSYYVIPRSNLTNSRTRHGRHDVALPLHGAHLSSTTLHCHLTVHSARLSTSPCHFTVPVHRERPRPTLSRHLLGVNNPALLFYGAHSASTTLPCHFTVPAHRQSRYLFRPYYRRLS
jgi:hypothetical protein